MLSANFISYPLKFRPVVKERLWGGERLASFFGLEEKSSVGEVWTLSDHANGPSVCTNGPLAGRLLTEIIRLYPMLYLGQTERDCFPLLIKFIHAKEKLSVQIHPDDVYAKKREGDYGKTEAWYILEAEPGAMINDGHTFTDRLHFKKAVAEGRVEEFLRYREVKADDFVYVPSRTLHAIMQDILLIEIQQTSDITYRVYDWNREDETGKARELHIDKAASVLQYNKRPPFIPRMTVLSEEGIVREHLITCDYFTIDKWILSQEYTIDLAKLGQPDILICARGSGTLLSREMDHLPVKAGDTLLIPSDLHSYTIKPDTKMTFLRAYYEQ